MGPMYGAREPQPTAIREPLVEINVQPPQPGEPQVGVKPLRKHLSDMETEGGEAQPKTQPKPQRRRLLKACKSGSDEPPLQPQPERCRVPLVDIEAAPDGPELRPRAERPRVAGARSSGEVPGLQDIINPPHSSNDSPALGQAKVARLGAELRTKHSFSMAVVGSLAAAVVGAMVWALLAAATNHQLGWMAVGVGFLIGGVVRTLGRGTDKSFGYLGAAMSVFGCLLGNILSICTVVAGQEDLSLVAVVAHVGRHPVLIPGAMLATLHSMDLLFYGVALYGGYRFSFRRMTEAQPSRD
jgi:hypothetical protein